MPPKIKFILILFSSERDTSGNTYHAAKWVDVMTGATVYGIINDPRAFEHKMPIALGMTRNDGYIDNITLSKKEFKAFTKNMPYIHFPYGEGGESGDYFRFLLTNGGNAKEVGQ